MAHNIPPPQSTFFYQQQWTPEIDSLLLCTILRMKTDLNWKGTVIPSHFLLEAEAAIEEKIGCRFSWDALYDRVQFLEHRYRTFKDIVDIPETYWDVHANTVTAADKVWRSIFKKNKLAGAYYYRGEPEFQKLALLFGSNAIKSEHDQKVIIISDTTISAESAEGSLGGKDAVSEEVTSPIVGQTAKLRRKLFDDSPQPLDLESTNDKGNYYYEVGPDGETNNELQNVYPPRISNPTGKPTGSPHASSCASSSPSKWWRNPFK